MSWVYDQIDSANKLFLDLENPLNRRYFEDENYERIKGTFEILGIDFGQRPFIFLDEIQFVKNIPSIVKYFIDHYRVKFFLTGSASFYLKNLFTESLSGRKYVFEIYPLNFQEFLAFKNAQIKIPRGGAVSYEVKTRPYDSDLRRLRRVAGELGLRKYTLVSKEYCDLENTIYGFQL